MKAGVTNSFHSEVTLISGDNSETIHNYLQENCTTPSPVSSNDGKTKSTQ
jgi:hypothetical protein